MITLFFSGKLEEEITRLADPAIDDDRRYQDVQTDAVNAVVDLFAG